jgi:lipoyl(octanoyl) transferase
MLGSVSRRCATFVFQDAIDYGTMLVKQRTLMRARLAARDPPDLLLVCQHPLVYTAGRKTRPDQIPSDLDVIRIERGGQITCHCPGK